MNEIANEELRKLEKVEKQKEKKQKKREAKKRKEKERKRNERAAKKQSAVKESLDQVLRRVEVQLSVPHCRCVLQLYELQKKLLNSKAYSDQWHKFKARIQDVEDRITELTLAGDFSAGSSVCSPSEV